jgi:hypothetical protein
VTAITSLKRTSGQFCSRGYPSWTIQAPQHVRLSHLQDRGANRMEIHTTEPNRSQFLQGRNCSYKWMHHQTAEHPLSSTRP